MVDVIRIPFFGYAIMLVWRYIQMIGNERMTTIDLPKNLVYGAVLLGFVLMFARSVQVAVENWRRGYSILERPGAFDGGSWSMLLLLGAFLAPDAARPAGRHRDGGSALVYILLTGIRPTCVAHRMISGIDSFPLLAVPFFILAGNLMNIAGITNRIYNFALALVGWMKGGLGHVNIIGSVIFAGMSGTAIADAAGLGTIEIKAMQDHGYATDSRSASPRRPPRSARSSRRRCRS